MDIGRYRASRLRLMLWVVLPPAMALVFALGSYVLRLQSEWKLTQSSELGKVLPMLVRTRQDTHELLTRFQNSSSCKIGTEDRMISFLQETAKPAGFTIDTLKVERRKAAGNLSMPMLRASVTGQGSLSAVEQFLKEVGTGQFLLSEKSLKLSRPALLLDDRFKAELELDLLLFKSVYAMEGGAQ